VLERTTPSLACQIGICLMAAVAFIASCLVWGGRAELLDWLYVLSALKLAVSAVKYTPQALLNWRLRSVEGFAIGQILADLGGSVLSFTQLAVSATVIDGDPAGIVANPVKLGISIFGVVFDCVFLVQKYWLFRDRRIKLADADDES